MKLSELFRQEIPTLSFEVFPPKSGDSLSSVREVTREIAGLRPDFMSVTYGASGSTGAYTLDIARELTKECGVTAIAHLTCVTATKESVSRQLAAMKAAGVENVLALRGDLPAGFTLNGDTHYRHASELVDEILRYSDFCVGGACYPECHPESPDVDTDIMRLKEKADRGCSFLTTQMFFDNGVFYRFLERARAAGITVPIVAGIMPVTSAAQVARVISLSGCRLPSEFTRLVDKFGGDPEAMFEAGVAYATAQIADLLASGVNNIHIYTMNRYSVASAIRRNFAHIIPPRQW